MCEIEQQLPVLPDALQKRFSEDLGLSAYDAGILTAERAVAEYFQLIVDAGIDAKLAANWIATDLFRLMKAKEIEREDIDGIPINAANFAGLLALVEKGIINQSTARKKVLDEMWSSGRNAQIIVRENGLAQISDPTIIEEAVVKVMSQNDDMVQKLLAGNIKVMNALFGKIMGELRGKADPGIVRKILQEKLERLN